MPKSSPLAAVLAALAATLVGAVVAQARPGGAGAPAQELTPQMLYEFLLGEIAAQRGEPQLAAQTYVALARRTRDARIARRALELASAARMPALALEAARLWHEADPDSPQAMQSLAQLLVQQKRVAEAEPVLAKLLAAQPAAAANVFMQLPRVLAASHDPAANLRLVERLAARYPTLAQAQFAVAQIAAAAGEEQRALEALRAAQALRPDWELAALAEAQLLERRSAAAAAARLEEFLARNPGSREVRLQYARLLAADKRVAQARAEFERILAAQPQDADAIYAVGVLAMQAKDYETAEAKLTRLLELGARDADRVHYTLGQIAEERKDWERAVQWYDKIERGELALAARMRTAQAIARQGRLEAARAYLRNVAASGEQRVQLLLAESQLLREARRHQEAFDLLAEALAREPDQPDLLYDQALTAEKLDRLDVLESNLKRLIQLRPDHAHAYNALGYTLADRNLRLAEAKKLIEKALELAPEDAYILDSMGWVLYRLGDLKGAVRYLRQAWEGRPDGEIGAHLGEVLWVLGEREEARRIWREAEKLGPDNETLQKTLKRFNP
ncbi:MAG: tetratricopeptide repeat protein [Burkholderiales bacterium]|nr:tetratricopeptide repeat protein [Burkholderiales bacterium]